MPESDKPTSDGSEDEGRPPVRGEGRTTVREMLLAGFVQAFMAGVADEAAHWFFRCLVWLYEMLVSRL
ncbi:MULTISPECIES: hypothetical protein [unclassified Streptomyces]|uniref:hypothetical protein n=1 Tax=unclassified Streptomyces TaxID=2593676 RepID=UPI002E0E5962|nr:MULTISPECIES: hypothetical protein [unclassified Streptomyces]WSQ03897.1 hypothetical protein OG444_40305 [Streptomyces sp. NBC_01232]WSR21167.1 hypothetical protein OG457_49600 [Streptomyces sp. NBC_01207]